MQRHKMPRVMSGRVLSVRRVVRRPSHTVILIQTHAPVWQNKKRLFRWALKGWDIPSLFLCPQQIPDPIGHDKKHALPFLSFLCMRESPPKNHHLKE